MFDVGFSELVVIGVVALLVLGPERLPRLARDVGRWVGRARRYVNRVREEIDREVELGELRRLRDEVEARARDLQGEADAAATMIHATLDDVAQPTAATKSPPVKPADSHPGSDPATATPATKRGGAKPKPSTSSFADLPAPATRKRATRVRKAPEKT